jgi:hypothetical protein
VSLHVRESRARSGKEEKEYFMAVSIKKTVLMVILVLALLAGLVGWSMRLATVSGAGAPHNTGLHTGSHLLVSGDGDNDYDDGGTGTDAEDNWYCPPPPRYC